MAFFIICTSSGSQRQEIKLKRRKRKSTQSDFLKARNDYIYLLNIRPQNKRENIKGTLSLYLPRDQPVSTNLAGITFCISLQFSHRHYLLYNSPSSLDCGKSSNLPSSILPPIFTQHTEPIDCKFDHILALLKALPSMAPHYSWSTSLAVTPPRPVDLLVFPLTSLTSPTSRSEKPKNFP